MSKPSIGGNLDARDLRLFLAGGPALELAQLALGEIGGKAGNLAYRAERVTFRELRSAADASAPEGAEAAWASADQVELDFGTFQLRADRLEFPSGIHFEGKRTVVAPEARIENLVLSIPDMGAFGRDNEPAAEPTPPAPDPAAGDNKRLLGIEDWSFLDAIDGHLNVDLFVDTTVPLLGRRRATHHFRIPIEGGTIDYRGVEDNLHWLEDAFLDLEVTDGKLVLEQDLPLVPFAGKALVWWNLSAKELELARQRRVRVQTLLSPILPPPSTSRRKKPSVTFHQCALRNLDLDLSLRRDAELVVGDVARVQVGAGGRPGVVELKLDGDLQYHMRRQLEPTAVSGTLHRLSAGQTGLFFKPVTITAAGVELGPIDAANMVFQGISPSSIEARLVAATIRDLRVVY